MSIIVMTQVFSRSFGNCARKAVALKLADHADDEGRGIWPSLDRLAVACDLSRATVKRVLADFVSCGLLVKVGKGGNGPGSTNRYDMALTVLQAMPKAGEAASGAASGEASEATENSHEAGENKGVTVNPLADEKGFTEYQKGVHREPQTIKEPSRTILLQDARERDEGLQEEEEGVDADFQEQPVGSLSTEQRKALIAAWHHWDGRLRGSEDWLLREAARLTPGELQRASDPARIDAWRKVEHYTGQPKLKLFGAYLKDRKFDLDAVTQAMAGPAAQFVRLAPYGKDWMAWRLMLLRDGPMAEWKPTPMQQRLLDKGMDLSRERAKARYPAVAALDRDAEAGRDTVISVDDHQRLKGRTDLACEARVRLGSEEWRQWVEDHLARGAPPPEPPRHVEWLFMPERALMETVKGASDAGNG